MFGFKYHSPTHAPGNPRACSRRTKYDPAKREFLHPRGFEELSFEDWLSKRAPEYLRVEEVTSNKDILGHIKKMLGGREGIKNALVYVQAQEMWYMWDDSVDSAEEAAEKTTRILHKTRFAKPNKEYETTLASLYIACVGAKKRIDPEMVCEQIHDAWCCTNAYTESLELLVTKRQAQYVPFDELSEEEQKKDLVWIKGVLVATMKSEE